MIIKPRSFTGESLLVATHAYATRIDSGHNRVNGVVCKDARVEGPDSPEIRLGARIIVLAASPIESARLMLNSKLGNEWTGRFLAEHMYSRWSISVVPPPEIGDIHRLAVRVVVPPQGEKLEDRFQVEVLGEEDSTAPGRLLLRFTGEGAMQPRDENRVMPAIDATGRPLVDEWGVQKAHVKLLPIEERLEDENRLGNMWNAIRKLAERLGVKETEFHDKGELDAG